jgi:hypothetical protein
MGTTATQLHRARLGCALYCGVLLLHCSAPSTEPVASSAVSDTANGATSQSETPPDATSADTTTAPADTQDEPAPTLGEVWVTVSFCGEPDHALRRASETALFRPIANCDEEIVQENGTCTDSKQCQSQPYGRCTVIETKRCVYDRLPETECTTDEECDATPYGSCEFRSCADPMGHCLHRQSCETDLECKRAGEGVCQTFVESPGLCDYSSCSRDADCVSGERCGCGSCVPASCMSDADCLGQCRLSTRGCNVPEFFACQDDPAACLSEDSGADCLCQSRDEAWACYASSCGPH